jgi:regulatory protein
MPRRILEPQDPLERARAQALRLLSVRSRSRNDLRQRLLKAGHAAEVVDPLLQRLQETGLLDDRRYASERARTLGERRGYGPRKIRAELGRQGLDREVLQEALEGAYAGQDVSALMRGLVVRRFGEEVLAREAEPKRRQRAQRYLLARGFEPDKVFSLFERP